MGNRKKREIIIEEAAKIFKTKGFAASSMRELAEQVGVEAASLYNHIRSKDEILEEICFKVAHSYMSTILEISDLEISSTEKIKRIISAHILLVMTHPNDVAVANVDWKNLSETKKNLYKEIRKGYEQRIATVIKKGIESGEFKEVNVSVALFTLLSAIRWVEQWYKPNRSISAEELEKDMITLLINGLKK